MPLVCRPLTLILSDNTLFVVLALRMSLSACVAVRLAIGFVNMSSVVWVAPNVQVILSFLVPKRDHGFHDWNLVLLLHLFRHLLSRRGYKPVAGYLASV